MPLRAGASKQSIYEAATTLFTQHGYAHTTVRDIATAAGVDPALVIRHFGSKVNLFIETMRTTSAYILTVDAPLPTMGEHLVRFVLNADERVRSTYLALVRASDTEDVATLLRTVHEDTIVKPLRDRLDGPDAGLRAAMIASMVAGLMHALWIARDRDLLSAPPEQIVAHYAPIVQALVQPHGAVGEHGREVT
ncbi:TetR family transcriptional regulator [Promicromonospora sp. AC04]|uniref:TetR/AcrR family transcriptional regulator n=1 Tax=Promicromonospora sp. AC04 TaxID=2135723 RepID=UPI000D3D9AFD|nr:TetR family transcriptional regulator [Promicromonospora sp. AC04]PUB32317.1 TetR family transcriptional regulator [Promicromonospora sp. AC04]